MVVFETAKKLIYTQYTIFPRDCQSGVWNRLCKGQFLFMMRWLMLQGIPHTVLSLNRVHQDDNFKAEGLKVSLKSV